MTAIESNPLPDPQSPGQWAVRWFAVILFGVLCASVPLVHVLWHGVLGHDEPAIMTRSQTPADAPGLENVMSGDWMQQKERELQEASPVVWSLRGHWNELRYRLGIPQSDRVNFGRDEWFFLKVAVAPNVRAFERAKARRLAAFEHVRDEVRKAGAELVVSLVPDKVRIYSDRLYGDRGLPKRKAGNYDVIKDEIESLGIAFVDLATPLLAARQAITSDDPREQLYFARDSHWLPTGALAAATALATSIETRFGRSLQPRQKMQLTGPNRVRVAGDLTSMLGMLSHVRTDPVIGERNVTMSLLTDRLAEVREFYGVNLIDGGNAVPFYGDREDAEIYLAGTSFAKANGWVATTIALGRPVHAVNTLGANGLESMREVLALLRSGRKPKVVIWEIVERGLFEAQWRDPKL